MTIKKLSQIALAFIALACTANAATISLENESLILSIDDQSGDLTLLEKATNRELVTQGSRALYSHVEYDVERVVGKTAHGIEVITSSDWNAAERTVRKETFTDSVGAGSVLVVRETSSSGITAEFSYHLYNGDRSLVLIGVTVINQSGKDFRLFGASPLESAQISALANHQNFRYLEGGAGNEKNNVMEGADVTTRNSLMLFGESEKGRTCVVAGGARYEDYLRWVRSRNSNGAIVFDVMLTDPFGKLIPAGTTYGSNDLSLISFQSTDPFEILEDYGLYFAELNSIKLNYYNFPTLCGWHIAGAFNRIVKGAWNRGDGLVQEAKDTQATGLTRFMKVASRLEPDTYPWRDNGNTSQGWWTDDRFLKYNRLAAPIDTFEKFCQGILEADGIPFTYHQVNMPSRDFVRAHPNWVMNKDITHVDREYRRYNIFMDFTHPEWREHFLNVWKRWRANGLEGIKFDYPQSGWIKDGGFHDPTATTSYAYRQPFALSREGLGDKAYIHERALHAWNNNIKEDYPFQFHYLPSDLCVGIVDLQRTAGDNDHLSPDMMALIGLRWYKNRTMVSYYPDSKAMHLRADFLPDDKKHEVVLLRPSVRQNIFSQIYFISGRLELNTPTSHLDEGTQHDLTRVFPVLQSRKSPRPVDAFSRKGVPQVYAYDVEPGWQQVMVLNSFLKHSVRRNQMSVLKKEMGDAFDPIALFYKNNDDPKGIQKIDVPLSGDQVTTGSLGLDPAKEYHVTDFWAQEYVGRFKGSQSITSEIKPQESRILSVREAKKHPQVISTDRHIMQGMFELSDVSYSGNALSGKLDIIENDPITITIALNGKSGSTKTTSDTPGVEVKVTESNAEWVKVQFKSPTRQTITWEVTF